MGSGTIDPAPYLDHGAGGEAYVWNTPDQGVLDLLKIHIYIVFMIF